jgi:Cu-Zn family superoxide dismutase
MKMMKAIALPLAVLLSAGFIAACGDDETTSQTSQSGDASSTETGSFALVKGAPDGFDDVSGAAKLVRNDGGTDASIELAGLKPSAKYVSHVHADACDQADPGGPHFKFDSDGADMPPNEIHLPFASDAQGNGSAQAHNDKTVPAGEGRSIVVHRAPAAKSDSGEAGHSHAGKIACAPLDGAEMSDGAAAAPAPTTTSKDEAEALAIDVKDGKPVGAIQSLVVKKGEQVRFTVTSNKTYEIHTHGYEVMKDAAPGKPATFDFPASIEGIFEVEVEDTGEQILKLTVNP